MRCRLLALRGLQYESLHPLGGVSPSQRCRGGRHGSTRSLIIQEGTQRVSMNVTESTSASGMRTAPPRLHNGLCVQRLMIIRRVGIRNEHRWDAQRRELGYRRGPRTCDHKIRGGEGRAHGVDVVAHMVAAGVDPRGRDVLGNGVVLGRTGDVDDVHVRLGQKRPRKLHHRGVDLARTTAPAEHQKHPGVGWHVQCGAPLNPVTGEDFGSDGVAGDNRPFGSLRYSADLG